MQELDSINVGFIDLMSRIVSFLPQLLGGLFLLLIGLFVADILKGAIIGVAKMLNTERVSKFISRLLNLGTREDSAAVSGWTQLLGEVVKWSVVIIFLTAAAEAWGLPRVTEIFNSLLMYLPNVFVAVLVGFIGLTVSNLLYQVIHNSANNLGGQSANLLANVGKYAVIIFTVMVILNQLGIATELVQILFTGIVAMAALAGGLAFGLGGKEAATKFLNELNQNLRAKSKS